MRLKNAQAVRREVDQQGQKSHKNYSFFHDLFLRMQAIKAQENPSVDEPSFSGFLGIHLPSSAHLAHRGDWDA